MTDVIAVGVITALNLTLLVAANHRKDRLMVAACLVAIAAAVYWLVTRS